MKNTITPRPLFSRILAIALFFSASFPAFGQEFIREAIDFLLCDTSIVRSVSSGSTLVYNYHNISTFMLPVMSDTIPTTTYFENIRINDMEIYKGKVYLCGHITVDNEKKAMIGYFKLSDIPLFDINYYIVDTCKQLKKLDFYTIEEVPGYKQLHLVAIGTTSGSRTDALIDLDMDAMGGMNCNVHISLDENENYDDIAVTEKKVVVSSRNKIQNIPVVYFWYYKRPVHSWEHIFSFNANRFLVYNPVPETPVILEHTVADSFAAVYKIGGLYNMAMLKIDATSQNYGIFEIVGNKLQASIPMDIKYKTRTAVYSILARNGFELPDKFIPPMQIFHVIPQDLQGVTPYGQGRDYTDRYFKLWSIDTWSGYTTRFVVSGAGAQIPALFRFNQYQWNCSHRFEYKYSNGVYTGDIIETPVSYYSDLLEIKKKIRRNEMPVPFPVVCGSETK